MMPQILKCDLCNWNMMVWGERGDEILDMHKKKAHPPVVSWPERMVPLTDEEEFKLRRALWYGHEHYKYLYGDDGEMQCSNCNPMDYKRSNLSEIIEAADKAMFSWQSTLDKLSEEWRKNKDAE